MMMAARAGLIVAVGVLATTAGAGFAMPHPFAAPASPTAAPSAQNPPAPARPRASYGPVVPGDIGPVARPEQRPPGISPALYEAVEAATSEYPGVASRKAAARAAGLDVRVAKSQRFSLSGSRPIVGA